MIQLPRKLLIVVFLFTTITRCQMVQGTLDWFSFSSNKKAPLPKTEIESSPPVPNLKVVGRSLVLKKLRRVLKRKDSSLDNLLGKGISQKIRVLDGKRFTESKDNILAAFDGERIPCQQLKDYRRLAMGFPVFVPVKSDRLDTYTKGVVAGINRSTRELMIIYRSDESTRTYGIQSYDISSFVALRVAKDLGRDQS